MVIKFLRSHKESPILRPLVRAKYHFLEKVYYLIYSFSPSLYRRRAFRHSANGTQTQKKIWTQYVIDNENMELKPDFTWGKGELERYHRYDVIKSMVMELIDENSVVLELGAYDGMWTQYFLRAKKIICVDVMAEAFDLIKKRCKVDKITFYQTEGNELAGVEDASVDVVFSINALMRIDLKDLEKYFLEFKRVLKPGGKAIIHLPSISKRGCQLCGFIYLTPGQIKRLAGNNFSEFRMHHHLLSIGIILEAVR